MNTPFDNITWRLWSTGHSHPPTGPIATTPPNNAVRGAGLTAPVTWRPDFADPINTPHRPPLKRHSHFMINIADDESVEVVFLDSPSILDSAYDNIKSIWADAQNVYYDRVFYAIRGDLMYDKQTGDASPSYGKHFVISYDGRMATGGSKRQLSIELYGESAISTPTFELLQPLPPRFFRANDGSLMTFMPSDRGGSWKADN